MYTIVMESLPVLNGQNEADRFILSKSLQTMNDLLYLISNNYE